MHCSQIYKNNSIFHSCHNYQAIPPVFSGHFLTTLLEHSLRSEPS